MHVPDVGPIRWITHLSLSEIQAGLPPAALSIDPQAETFSRADLISLAHQIDDLLWSERTNTYILSPVTAASPPPLVLQDALFQGQDLARVRQEYRAGHWQVLRLPGQTD